MSDLKFSLSASHDVSALAAPLFSRSGINSFSYSRVYRDGSRAELWTDANALRHTFLVKKYIVGAYTPAFYGPGERYALFEKKIDTFPRQICERYAIQLNDQKHLFDHAYPFKIVSRHRDYFEYFLFYASAKRNGIIKLCLSPPTVETHIENMRHKLGCANRTELVVCFLQEDMHRSARAGQS